MTRRHTPGFTPAGCGRAGSRRSAGKSTLKRGRASLGVRPAIEGISKNSFKKLARRAGVARISGACYDPNQGIPKALMDFLLRVVPKLVTLAEHARRFTITSNDVAYALKQMGITFYKEGLDWTYGFYTRAYVRQRVARPVERALLEEAAASRAESQAGSVGAGAGAEAAPASTPAATAAATTRAAAAAAERPAGVQPQGSEGEGSVARGAAALAAAAAAAQEEQRASERAAALHQQREQQQEEAAAAAAEAELLSPEAQQQRPAANAAAGGKPAAPATVAAAARRLSDVPTPAGVMSEARCAEIQSWMADVMHGPLSQQGCISKKHLKRVMLARHSCTAAEVQDVLFVLERKDAIMVDGDEVFLCN